LWPTGQQKKGRASAALNEMQAYALDRDSAVTELRPESRGVEGRERVGGGGLNDVIGHSEPSQRAQNTFSSIC
jgi:hypothetical protein